jgi:hypothetical protein
MSTVDLKDNDKASIDQEADESNGSEFIVEKILDKRIKSDGTVMYFLKWKDYPE